MVLNRLNPLIRSINNEFRKEFLNFFSYEPVLTILFRWVDSGLVLKSYRTQLQKIRCRLAKVIYLVLVPH